MATRALLVASLLAFAIVSGCSKPDTTTELNMTDRDKADMLARQVAQLGGIDPAPLNAQGRIAYGTLQFEFDPAHDQLVVAILVAQVEVWNKLGDDFRDNYLKTIRALDDPRIGGMFDTAGGHWRFEPETGKTFLYRSYPLDTPPRQIKADLDRMADVVPAWETRWTGAVGDIVHGQAPPPPHKVTLDNDPYAGQL